MRRLIGGEYDEGALRLNGKTAGYYSVSSAFIGLTLRAAKRREIIVFTPQDRTGQIRRQQRMVLGGGRRVAVLSKGASAEYDRETWQRPILDFVFGEEGLIGNPSLDGSKINKLDQ